MLLEMAGLKIIIKSGACSYGILRLSVASPMVGLNIGEKNRGLKLHGRLKYSIMKNS